MAEPDSTALEAHFKLVSQFLETAAHAKKLGDLRSAADRIYYAMFHAATAALISKGVRTKTHHGLHGQFAKEFVKTGQVDQEIGSSLVKAFELRQASDYEVNAIIEESQIDKLLESAKKFIASMKFLSGV